MKIIRYVSKEILKDYWRNEGSILWLLNSSYCEPMEHINADIPIKIIIPDKD